jgi:hypothetical protein
MNSPYTRRILQFTFAPLAAICMISCATGIRTASEAGHSASTPSFTVVDRELGPSPRFIVYGDTRFTDPTETKASFPGPRRTLVAQIGREKPDAVFITGDVPWHGGNMRD